MSESSGRSFLCGAKSGSIRYGEFVPIFVFTNSADDQPPETRTMIHTLKLAARIARRWILGFAFAFMSLCLGAASPAPAEDRPAEKNSNKPAVKSDLKWLTDYGAAMTQAEVSRKFMLIYFYENEPSANQRRFEAESLAIPQVVEKLRNECVLVKVPLGYEVSVGGELGPLMNFEAFADLNRRPGLAMIDYVHEHEDIHGYVVSVLPLDNGKYYRFSPDYVRTILELPAGTLTQRTMIFAVRVHPEKPASTRGRPNTSLFTEAREHSFFQARLRNQGHHNWGSRFQRITNLLGGGLRAQEVVAESWPGENLVDAAIDCVDCWRQSPGHWGAVVSDQPQFGYDIKKGENGIWYATGLFGNRHD